MLGVAGAIVVAILWVSGSPEAVPIVVGALLLILASMRDGKAKSGQSQGATNPEVNE